MHETMRRSLKSKMVRSDETIQETTTMQKGVMIKIGKNNQADDVLVQNFNNKKPPALTPLSPKSWPNGSSLPGTQLPPIFAPTPHKDQARGSLCVTRSIVNERKGASRKCAPVMQRPLDSGAMGTNGGKSAQVPTIHINSSEKVSLYMTKDKMSLVKSTPAAEQDGLRMSSDEPRTHRVKKDRRQQRENGCGYREDSENRYQDRQHHQKSSKLRRAYASRPFAEAGHDVAKGEVDLHIHVQVPESLIQDPSLYRRTQPAFHVPPLRAVLPPIGGLRPVEVRQPRKRDKKKSREAKRREKEKEWKSKLLEDDLKLRTFFQSLAMNRRDATCVEVDRLLNEGILVKFSESLVLLAAMQWWL